jgi:hypothetical protein
MKKKTLSFEMRKNTHDLKDQIILNKNSAILRSDFKTIANNRITTNMKILSLVEFFFFVIYFVKNNI